ncbi:tetratricopeptide repeat protein [Acidobacteriota bacterium]
MTIKKIIDEIASRLTGDAEKDMQTLMEEAERYKDDVQALEISRAIGRMLYKILPEDAKAEYQGIMDKLNLSRVTVLDEVKLKIKEGKLGEAEKIIKGLIPDDEIYREDKASLYFAFSEPIQEIFYRQKFEPSKEVRWAEGINTEVFVTYAYLLFEREDYDGAMDMLDRGLARNPLDTRLLFEKSEIYKLREDWDAFVDTIDLCREYAYRAHDVARVYRGLGYMFIEQEDWDTAICCYLLSLSYGHHPMAQSQLFCIQQKIQKKIDADHYYEHLEEILKRKNIAIGPPDENVAIPYAYGESAEEEEDYELACYFYSIVYDLTGDKEIGQKLETLKTHLP